MVEVGLLYTLRKHWKKSIAASLLFCWGTSYAAHKFRQNLQRRRFCRESQLYGKEPLTLPTGRPRTIYVFLNPYAAGGKARKLFEKNAAPVLHVAGMDVTVVETSSREQLRMLMDYVPNDVDALVVAGGRGTMLEVISGLLTRKDKERPLNVPLGYIPLGEGQNDVVTLLGVQDADKVVETCKAALAIVKGHTRSVDLMQVQPEGGKPVFAMDAVEWGILHDINERTPKFWWTGKMRRFSACLEAVLKHQWPLSAVVRLQCSGVQEVTANGKAQMEPETPHRRLFGGQLSWVQTASTESSGTSTISSVSRASRDTNMSASQTSTRASLQCVNLTVQCNKVGMSPGLMVSNCLSTVERRTILTYGLHHKKPDSLPVQDLCEIRSVHFSPDDQLSPWMSVDGEKYDSRPITVQWLPGRLLMFCATDRSVTE